MCVGRWSSHSHPMSHGRSRLRGGKNQEETVYVPQHVSN
jgi:hypothetical protein